MWITDHVSHGSKSLVALTKILITLQDVPEMGHGIFFSFSGKIERRGFNVQVLQSFSLFVFINLLPSKQKQLGDCNH